MSDEFKPDGPSRLATGADFVAAMTQANEFLIERDRRIAELEAALKPFAALGAQVRWIDGSGYVTARIRTADIVAAQKTLKR